MASSPYGPGTNFVRWFFVICNFVFLALGAVTMAIGIWGIVVGGRGGYDIITGENTLAATAVLLTAGALTLAVAGLGIWGAWGMWRPILIIYTVAVLLIIILEIVAAILAFVYRNNITGQLGTNMKSAIEDYRVYINDTDYDEDTNNAVENVQNVFQCCGVNGSDDWLKLSYSEVVKNNNVPPGCCCTLTNSKCKKDTSYNVWRDGCISLLEDNIRAVMLVIGVVGIVFAVIESLLMALAISLCCCIRSTQKG